MDISSLPVSLLDAVDCRHFLVKIFVCVMWIRVICGCCCQKQLIEVLIQLKLCPRIVVVGSSLRMLWLKELSLGVLSVMVFWTLLAGGG